MLGLPVASIRPETWRDLRDLAVLFGGADPSRPANAAYGLDHFQSVAADPVLAGLAGYRTIFIDSLTQAMRLCRVWAETQPESFNERGRKDLRGTYGLIAREGVAFLQQFQRDRSRNIIFVAVLERVGEDLGVATWRPQIEGAGPAASCRRSSTKSSPSNYSTSATASRFAPSCAQRQTPGDCRQRQERKARQVEKPRPRRASDEARFTRSNQGEAHHDSPFDYSDSAPIDMELIPAGEIAIAQMRIRAGGGGEDGVLKRSKNGHERISRRRIHPARRQARENEVLAESCCSSARPMGTSR